MKHNIQKLLALMLAAVLAVAMFAGCSSSSADTASDSTASSGETAPEQTDTSNSDAPEKNEKILYFVVGNLGDLSYGDMGWWATQAVAEKYGYEYDVVEGGADTANYTTTLCDAIETGGYTYVIAAGWYIVDDVLRLAGTDYQDVTFILFDTGVDVAVEGLDNVYCIAYKANEASFVTAVYLSLMTKTGKVGAMSGNDSPLLNDFVTGFVDGMRYVNDEMGLDVEHLVTYIGAQTIQNNYETVNVMYDQGCDAIFNILSTTALGACQAAEEHGGYENGYYLVGVDCDQYSIYKDATDTEVVGYENLVTSMLKKVEDSVMWAFDGISDGSVAPGLHRVGYAEGSVGLAKNENYYALTPKDVQDKVEEVETMIANGEIEIPSYFDFASYEEFAQFRDA